VRPQALAPRSHQRITVSAPGRSAARAA